MSPPKPQPHVMVVMGVSGVGKSTVGRLLAQRLGVPFAEGDDFHSAANIAKLSAGHPLDDSDRARWLDAIAMWLKSHEQRGGIVSCSALKRRYRDRLRSDAGDALFFLHLTGSYELLASRLAERKGHYMPPSLLRSQFAALEPLADDEVGAVVPIGDTPQDTADRACAALPPHLRPSAPGDSHRTG